MLQLFKWSIDEENNDFVEFCIRKSNDVNIASESGKTPLDHVLKTGDANMFQLLLEKKVDLKNFAVTKATNRNIAEKYFVHISTNFSFPKPPILHLALIAQQDNLFCDEVQKHFPQLNHQSCQLHIDAFKNLQKTNWQISEKLSVENSVWFLLLIFLQQMLV